MLSGKVAFVTGASSGESARYATHTQNANSPILGFEHGAGIGLQVSKDLAVQGMAVVMAARRVDKLAAGVAEIESSGGKAVAVACDVTNPSSLKECAKPPHMLCANTLSISSLLHLSSVRLPLLRPHMAE